MVDIHANPVGSLPIGRRGENLARRVIFDLAPWRKCYGDGTVQLLHQRAGDADPYPCALTVEGDVAYWLIRAADVDKPGWGDAQLHYYVGDTLAKSSAWRTLTADALGAPSETPPEPQQDWVEKVLAAGTAAEDAAVRAEEAAAHPPYPSEETGTWWTWNAETGKYEDTGLSYGGSTDHSKLTNRDAENQHPMSAITGLVGALDGKVSVASIINNLTTNAANKPLSAAQGVELKALIDAISIPEKLPNPNALTFIGAVEGSYDGSAAKTINIPSGGGDVWEFGGTIPLDLTTPTARYEFAPCSIWKKVRIVRVRQSYNSALKSNVWYGASKCENSEGKIGEIRVFYTDTGYVYYYVEMMVDNEGGVIAIKSGSNNTNISSALNISAYSNNRVISNIPPTYYAFNVTEDSNWFIQAVDPSTAWDGAETYYWWGVRA